MKSWRLVAASAIAFLVMSAAPALAACAFGCTGGVDAFFYETQYLRPGQTVTWDTEAFLDKGAAGPDQGPFFAYLVDAGLPSRRVPQVDGGVELGTVETTTGRRPYRFDMSVTFTIPASTPLGKYAVEVCNDPCTTRLGYLWGTPVDVVSGDLEARLNERIDKLAQKVSDLRWSMPDVARRAAKRTSTALRTELAVAEENLDMRVSELELMVTQLERSLASHAEPAEREDVSQSALAGGIVVLVLGAWLIRERSRNRPQGWVRPGGPGRSGRSGRSGQSGR
jgi:hypothetical protein